MGILTSRLTTQALIASPQSDVGQLAEQQLLENLTSMRQRLTRPGGEIPADVKHKIRGKLDAALRAMRESRADGVITPKERLDLVQKARTAGAMGDRIVELQRRYNPVPAETYRTHVR